MKDSDLPPEAIGVGQIVVVPLAHKFPMRIRDRSVAEFTKGLVSTREPHHPNAFISKPGNIVGEIIRRPVVNDDHLAVGVGLTLETLDREARTGRPSSRHHEATDQWWRRPEYGARMQMVVRLPELKSGAPARQMRGFVEHVLSLPQQSALSHLSKSARSSPEFTRDGEFGRRAPGYHQHEDRVRRPSARERLTLGGRYEHSRKDRTRHSRNRSSGPRSRIVKWLLHRLQQSTWQSQRRRPSAHRPRPTSRRIPQRRHLRRNSLGTTTQPSSDAASSLPVDRTTSTISDPNFTVPH